MKTFFKKVLSVITALACLAPAAAISGLAAPQATVLGSEEFIHTYTFEVSQNQTADQLVDTKSHAYFGYLGAANSREWLKGGYAGNKTGVLKINKTETGGGSGNAQVWCHQFGQNVRYQNEDGTPRYMVMGFEIFTDGEGLEYVSLGSAYGAKATPGVSMEGTTWSNGEYYDASVIPVPCLKRNKWNKVVFVTKYCNKRDVGGYPAYDTVSDIYVNGKLVAADKLYKEVKNFMTSGETKDEEHVHVRLYFRSKFTSASSEQFTVYLDNASFEIYDEKPTIDDLDTAAPDYPTVGLVATDKYTVDDGNGTISAIPGTLYDDISAEIGCSYTIVAGDGSDYELNPGDPIANGDVITVTNTDGMSVSYTVTLLPAELSAPTNYISYSNGGNWDVYKSTDALIDDTYCYPAEVLNTTGKTVNITSVVALYEEDGTLVECALTTKPVESKLSLTSVRTDLNVTGKLGNGKRYIKAYIWDMDNMRNISRTSPQY